MLGCNSCIKGALFISSHPISTGSWNKWDCCTAAFWSQGHEGWGDTTQNSELTEVNTWQMSLLVQYNGITQVGQSSWKCSQRQSNTQRCPPPKHTHITGRLQNSTKPRALPGVIRTVWCFSRHTAYFSALIPFITCFMD